MASEVLESKPEDEQKIEEGLCKTKLERYREKISLPSKLTNQKPNKKLKTDSVYAEDKQGSRSSSKPLEISGYYPLRRDFDNEHDSEAENYLADMEFDDDDNEREIELKRQIFDIYNQRLTERIQRKNFVIDHGILDLERHGGTEKRAKEEKSIRRRLGQFERFFTTDEFSNLVSSILTVKDLNRRIKILEDMSMGSDKVASFDAVEKYLIEKRRECGENKGRRAANKPIGSLEEKEEMPSGERQAKLTEVETAFVQRFGLDAPAYARMRNALAAEALKQGYIVPYKDAKGTTHFKRSDQHAYMEMFDFMVTNYPGK